MLAVLAMETAVAQRRRNYAGILREPRAAPPLDPGDIQRILRTIRSDALDRQSSLVKQALSVWSQDKDRACHITGQLISVSGGAYMP